MGDTCTTNECPQGSECSFGACRRFLPAGKNGACGTDEAFGFRSCTHGQYCVFNGQATTGVCANLLASGDTCGNTLECGEGLTCSQGKCIEGKGTGDSCSSSSGECARELLCIQGWCVLWGSLADGEDCRAQAECESLRCDLETNTCWSHADWTAEMLCEFGY